MGHDGPSRSASVQLDMGHDGSRLPHFPRLQQPIQKRWLGISKAPDIPIFLEKVFVAMSYGLALSNPHSESSPRPLHPLLLRRSVPASKC
jgi:hypothetical protein